MVRPCDTHGRRADRHFVRKPEGQRPLGRPRDIVEDTIKMDPKEI
jgi:hypothetical protein